MKMRSGLVLAALLCFTTWMSMANANHGMGGEWCCIQWSTTKIPLKRIANYTNQSEGVCPVSAIIFHTTRGKTICSDPDDGWAKKAMKKVDEEKKKLQLNEQNEDETTSDITPAASTTSKNGPPKGRKGRKQQRQRSGRGKKRQNKRV